jgi:pimeloyl-ACP methyl ester carboxylesterase
MKPLRVLATVLVIGVACAQLQGCSAYKPETGAASTSPSGEQPLEISADAKRLRGSVVESQAVEAPSKPLADIKSTQIKVVYRSVSGIDGSERDVSGTVVVPDGAPPPGGWPIIAYGHGVTGIGNDCGPSAYPNLLGYDLVVASLVSLGFVVTLPDYEGLGHSGTHPYLEPRSAAFNMIDSVRAVRTLVPSSSTKWFAVGVSQGGQASWAANEYAGEYGEGLEFLGSASMAPVVYMSKFASLAESGWLSKEQQVLMPMVVHGLRATHPDLNPDDYLHGALARNTDVWLACAGPLVEKRSAIVDELRETDSEPVSKEAADRLEQIFTEYSMPQRPATAPMLVITGADDQTVRAQWVRAAVQNACGMGDVVEFIVRPNEGHANLNGGPRLSQWLTERMSGAPPIDTCGDV